MKRTQISLEKNEYEALLARADSEGRSMSSLVRDAVHEYLGTKVKGTSRLGEVRGIGAVGGGAARDHDSEIYGR